MCFYKEEVSRNLLTLSGMLGQLKKIRSDFQMKNNSKLVLLAQGGMIAALYTVATTVLAPLSFANIQFRASEALTVMPIFAVSSIPGLTVGCIQCHWRCDGGEHRRVAGCTAWEPCDASGCYLHTNAEKNRILWDSVSFTASAGDLQRVHRGWRTVSGV